MILNSKEYCGLGQNEGIQTGYLELESTGKYKTIIAHQVNYTIVNMGLDYMTLLLMSTDSSRTTATGRRYIRREMLRGFV